jgi:hypothetical protein
MKQTRSVKTAVRKLAVTVEKVVRKQAGEDAVIILSELDKMLKRGVPRKRIESALAAKLIAFQEHTRRDLILIT